MWSVITSFLAKWTAFKVLLKALGGLAWLIPIAFVLKAIGLPLLVLIAVLGAPIFLVLALVGLPVLAVLVVGGGLLALLFGLLAIGVVVLKIALPIVAVVWLVRWVLRRGTATGDAGATPPAAPDTP